MDGNPKLLIIGASGHGRVVADIALALGKWERIAFLDDNPELMQRGNLPILGRSTDALAYAPEWHLVVGIGNNETRARIQNRLDEAGFEPPVLAHPSAVVGSSVEIGPGTVVMPGAIINCGSTIGRGCIINTGATVDHDNTVGDYVHISPGAHLAGAVTVEPYCWLGIGCAVINNVRIASGCIIGAGAVVTRSIVENGTYVGVPARKT